jgi:probable phosphoglycerate mutase
MHSTVDAEKIYVSPALREIDLPAWQGLSRQYVQEQFAAEYRCWKQRPHQFQMHVPQHWGLEGDKEDKEDKENKGEFASSSLPSPLSPSRRVCFPVLDLYERAQQFWQEILPRHVGQTLLLVSHSGTNRALIATAMGLGADRYHALQQSNCGISILDFPGDRYQKAQLAALNLTTHLSETLPELKHGCQGWRQLLVPSGIVNPQQLQNLAELLKNVTIDFSISGDLANSQETAAGILQYHPLTVQLEVLHEDFPEVWQQAIYARQAVAASTVAPSSSQLVTGLVVAGEAIVKRIIGQVLGISSDQLCNFQLQPGTLSVIHYPAANQPAMLQAMNISSLAEATTSESVTAETNPIFMGWRNYSLPTQRLLIKKPLLLAPQIIEASSLFYYSLQSKFWSPF